MGPGSSLLEEAARFDQSRLVAEDGITAAGSANHLSASNTTSYPAIPCADAQQMVSNGTSTFFDNDKLLSSSGMVYNIEYKSISSARQQNDSLPQPAGEPRATVFEPRITRTPFTAVDDRNETHAPEALPVYHISLEVAEAMVLAGRANLMDDGAYLVTDDSQFFVVDGAEQMLEGAEEGEAEREQSTWDGGESDAGGLDDEDEL